MTQATSGYMEISRAQPAGFERYSESARQSEDADPLTGQLDFIAYGRTDGRADGRMDGRTGGRAGGRAQATYEIAFVCFVTREWRDAEHYSLASLRSREIDRSRGD